MKKYINLFIVLLLAFSVSATAFAKDGVGAEGSASFRANSGPGKAVLDARFQLQNNRQEDRGERQEDRKEFRGDMKDNRIEMKRNIRMFVVNNLLRRAENLKQISERIETRIEKLDNSIDPDVALGLIVKANASIADSKTASLDAKAKIEADASIEDIRASIDLAKEDLKKAIGYLRDAVKDIKSQLPDKPEAKVKGEIHGSVSGGSN